MKKTILPILVLAALTSCSSAYRTAQTPDDLYYSPATEHIAKNDENAEDRKKDDRRDDRRYDDDYYERERSRMRVRSGISRVYYRDHYDYYPDYYSRNLYDRDCICNHPYVVINGRVYNSATYPSPYNGTYSPGYYHPGYSGNNVITSQPSRTPRTTFLGGFKPSEINNNNQQPSRVNNDPHYNPRPAGRTYNNSNNDRPERTPASQPSNDSRSYSPSNNNSSSNSGSSSSGTSVGRPVRN